jgi:hypothetical protein
MAEGIMGLAPGMGAPAAPQQAPQQAGPDGMQAFLQAAGQMDSTEVEPQMDEALAEIDPALAQQIQADLSAIQLPPEIVQVLIDVVNGLLEAPQEYAQRRMEVIEAGLPADFLPEEFNIEYLATLRYVLMRLPMQEPEVPVQGFKDGGAVSLKPIAKFLAAQGRNGDTMLAHINPQEAALLKRMGGSGTINPVTGLREYGFFSKAWNSVKKAVSNVASAVKKVTKPITDFTKKILANPIVRTVATVAAAGTALSAAVGTSISTAGISLLAGEKPKDALKQGLMAGVVAGAGSAVMGNPLTESGLQFTPETKNVLTGIKETVGKGIDALNPFSGGTPDITADTKFDELVAKGLPRDANTYKLAQEAAKSANATTILGMSPSTAITTAATLIPPILAYAGQEPPPSPEDLDMPGVGGPTGADLLASDPGKYGIDIGGTSSAYIDPYAGMVAQNIDVGTQDQAAPGVVPNPAPGSMPTSAGFSPVLPIPSEAPSYDTLYSGYDPTKDPLSPEYNPFGVPTIGPSTGGFNVAQGFAEGGIAMLAKGGTAAKTRGGGRGSSAATAAEEKYYANLYGARSKAAAPAAKQVSAPTYGQRFSQQAEATRQAQAEAAARQRAEERTAAARNQRIDSAVNAAMQAAQEGRSYTPGAGYASEQGLYGQAIEAARQRTPTAFMLPAEAEAYVARQQIAAREAELAQQARQQQQADAIRAREEAAAAQAAAATQQLAGMQVPVTPPVTAAPVTPPSGIATLPSSPSVAPSLPTINIGSAGAGTQAPSIGTPVFGPDGTQYENPAAAITAGVFNYSATPPTATPAGIGALIPSAPTITLPSLAPSTVSPGNVPVAFANGGIAAMAPYKFKSGSNPAQHFPRRTGPINGPGTEKSDSIPAMLSDGEFVFTAKAVRGMGNGSRLKGAKKMYKMMKMLEGKG